PTTTSLEPTRVRQRGAGRHLRRVRSRRFRRARVGPPLVLNARGRFDCIWGGIEEFNRRREGGEIRGRALVFSIRAQSRFEIQNPPSDLPGSPPPCSFAASV